MSRGEAGATWDASLAGLLERLPGQGCARAHVAAFREWDRDRLRKHAAAVAAKDRENARLLERVAELERSAALMSTNSSDRKSVV